MKRFLAASLCATIVILLHSTPSAAPGATPVPLAYDDAGTIYLGMDIVRDQEGLPLTFDAVSPTGLSDPADLILAQYQAAAKANDTDSMEDLFSPSDGSKDTLVRTLVLTPDMFDNCSSLEQVRIDSRTYWGEYRFMEILLSGGTETREWREAVLCEDGACRMSLAFDGSTEKKQLLEAFLVWADVFLSGPYDPAELETQMTALRAVDRKISFYPDYLPAGAQTNPITVYANLEQLDQDESTFEIDPENGVRDPAPPPEVLPVLDMLKDAADSTAANIETALAPHFTSMPGGGLIRMTVSDDGTDDSGTLKSTAYTWEAFRDRVDKWRTLRVLGIARSGKIYYVYAQPGVSESENDTIQLFTSAFNESGNEYKIATDTDQAVTWYIFRNAAMLEFIYEQYH